MAISPSKAEEVLLYAPYGTCVVLVGPPGSVKSITAYRAARRANAVYVGKYTADMDVLDGKGVPYLIEGPDGKKTMAYAPLGNWPTSAAAHLYPEAGEIRLTLDDWGQSPPPVRRQTARAVYGDGTDRFLGDNQILPNVLFSATTNSVEDRAGVFQAESYAQNRVVDIRVEPNIDEWVSAALSGFAKPLPDPDYPERRATIEKAVALGMPSELIAFVKWSKHLNVFDPLTPGPFQSTRSLENLGKFMRAYDAVGIDGDILFETAVGTIGETQTAELMGFLALRNELPDVEAILRGEDVYLPAKAQVLYILCSTIIRVGKKEHAPAVAKLVDRIASLRTEDGKKVGVEISAYLFLECLRGAAKELRGVREHPLAHKWLRENGKYFT